VLLSDVRGSKMVRIVKDNVHECDGYCYNSANYKKPPGRELVLDRGEIRSSVGTTLTSIPAARGGH
jgi:hypothetical protein